jgi:hypothetical protein
LVCADPNGPVTKAPGHEGPLKESITLETKQADLPQDVATDEVPKASQSRASDSPVPGEHRGEAYTPNAATRSRGWSASEAGKCSIAV